MHPMWRNLLSACSPRPLLEINLVIAALEIPTLPKLIAVDVGECHWQLYNATRSETENIPSETSERTFSDDLKKPAQQGDPYERDSTDSGRSSETRNVHR